MRPVRCSLLPPARYGIDVLKWALPEHDRQHLEVGQVIKQRPRLEKPLTQLRHSNGYALWKSLFPNFLQKLTLQRIQIRNAESIEPLHSLLLAIKIDF